MKKVLALFLCAMLMLGSVSALAESGKSVDDLLEELKQ